MTSDVESFQSLHRIAMIGVSHDQRHFSRAVYRAWRDRGYELVPVNFGVPEIEGVPAYPRPQDIPQPVEAALIMTPPAASPRAVEDAVAAGIHVLWLYRRCPAAEALAAKAGATVIAGECPMMFLPHNGWVHRVHRWIHDRAS